MTVLLATGNPEKVGELTQLLAAVGITATWRDDLPSPEEDGDTYAANALIKARAAAATGVVAIADDSGLEVDALSGAPGLWTRRWADEQGGWPQARAALAQYAGSRARFHSALALVYPDGREFTGHGTTDGRIVPATVDGVGLEPCFLADGTSVPLPALPEDERRRVHYRARALDALLQGYTATA